MATYYIGADVHSNNTELAIEQRGRIVARYSVPTTIPAISTALNLLQDKKIFAMEEGPMAGWLYRNLNEKVEKFIVSEPRRNKLITCEGDKDDRIDSGKLAVLLRGNFLKAVHHSSDSDRAHLKHWVNLYNDRVRDGVRNIFHLIRRRAKVSKCTLHDLRRSAITNWASHIPIQVVQQLAGHSDIATTRKYYLAVRPEDMVSANKILNNILPKVKAD